MSNIYCCRSFIKALRIIEVYKLSLCRIFLVFFFSSFCFFFHSMNCILFIIFSPHYFLFNWSSKTMIAIFTSRDHQTWKIRLQLHSIIVLYYSACIFPSSASTQLNRESSKMEQDFKCFNHQTKSNSSSASASTQLKLPSLALFSSTCFVFWSYKKKYINLILFTFF